ncbi:phosphoesterase [Sphingomonas sp. DT-51]|uniref:DHH family phosphoesterase n=1 Tax=Sphingomonas sp. DT-51 TaxID=3396165 RepID=UPI003F1D8BB1
MVGLLDVGASPRGAASDGMRQFVDRCDLAGRIVVLSHFDADGLSAAAILIRALTSAGRAATPLIIGKTETIWDESVGLRIGSLKPVGLIVADLGTAAEPVASDLPTLVIDHHKPTGLPEGAVTLSGHGLVPEPTSALIAWWAAHALGDVADLQWLAALGLIGDMADEHAFPELAEAQARWGKTALRDATSLVNAPRRTAAADPSPALKLLLEADGPKAITKGGSPEARRLVEAKAEVRAAVEEGRRSAPQVRGEVALISLNSPCQIHPLIAQQWRARFRDKVVIAANHGYRPGWVHFAVRSTSGRDLLAFLAQHRPSGAGSRYGNGHLQATGGALPAEVWSDFAAALGF